MSREPLPPVRPLVAVTTIHDPDARLEALARQHLPALEQLFETVIVACSGGTSKALEACLREAGCEVTRNARTSVRSTYELAIQRGIQYLTQTGATSPETATLFHIDFDRLLHWQSAYPEELRDVLATAPEAEFLHVGRTSRAYRTHPATQTSTERIVNEVCSRFLAFDPPRDILSVCWRFSPRLAREVLALDLTTSTGFYAEWPVVLYQRARASRYVEVEGHEWETPDRFQAEIEAEGYEAWARRFQSPAEWEKRCTMAREMLVEVQRVEELLVGSPPGPMMPLTGTGEVEQ